MKSLLPPLFAGRVPGTGLVSRAQVPRRGPPGVCRHSCGVQGGGCQQNPEQLRGGSQEGRRGAALPAWAHPVGFFWGASAPDHSGARGTPGDRAPVRMGGCRDGGPGGLRGRRAGECAPCFFGGQRQAYPQGWVLWDLGSGLSTEGGWSPGVWGRSVGASVGSASTGTSCWCPRAAAGSPDGWGGVLQPWQGGGSHLCAFPGL